MKAPRPVARAYQVYSVGFLLYKLLTLAVNALALPTLRRRPPLVARPTVSLLLPARNEALTLPSTLPRLLAQLAERPGAAEVLVLDDASTDDTARIARDLCAAVPGARVLSGAPLPPGWHGKPWACWQLGQAARGEVVVFTDADVCWEPGALNALLHRLEATNADLLTVWPRQETRTWGERLLVPLVDDVLLSLLPTPLTRLPFASLSAGNGQLMAFRRSFYLKVGGHRLVRAEVLEDIRFASRLKARGGRIAMALGGDLLSVRMYHGYAGEGGSVAGFAKGLHAVHGGSRPLMAASWGWHFVVYTLPWLRGWPVLIGLGLLERLLVNVKAGRTSGADLAEVLLTPVTPLASLPVYLLAWRKTYRWKGREYTREAG